MFYFRPSWEFPDEKGAVLIFDKAAWALFQSIAKRSGIKSEEMISVVVAEQVGEIVRYCLRD